MEREPDAPPVTDDDDLDLFGDPDRLEGSIEEQLDEQLEEERQPD